MPSITIRVPFAATRLREGLYEATPLTLREICTVAETSSAAIRTAAKRIQEQLRGQAPQWIARHGVVSTVDARMVFVDLAPNKTKHHRQNEMHRESIVLPVATFGWSCGTRLTYGVAPQFAAQVISFDRDDADRLLAHQVRQIINARVSEDPSLIARLLSQPTGESKVIWRSLEIEVAELVPANQEAAAARAQATTTLKQVATRWHIPSLRRAYHREGVVKELVNWIGCDDPRSVVLVGKSGVGKTAIVQEAIRTMAATASTPPKLYATDGSRLIAGQCGFGMLQEQCMKVAQEAEKIGAILHLGNLMQLIESGKINGSGGCGSILAPRIATGKLIVIMEATPEELSLAQRSEPRLMSAVEVFHVDEPDAETTRMILMESALSWRSPTIPTDVSSRPSRKKRKAASASPTTGLRSEQGVAPESQPKIDMDALIAIDQLHRRFPTDSATPGRPLAFLNALIGELPPGETLTVDKVNEAFSRQTGLPSFLTDASTRPDLFEIRRLLSADVVGQPHAIDAVIDTIATLATWLSRGDRPLASLLLIGPTGVGKTETAKAIARLIYRDPSRMVRIDLSEYSTPDAARRLIGDAYGGEGVLTGAIRAQPFSLLLLDEFEKADHGVFDLLLQVLGEGRLTDARGRLADFRNSIVLMTSNLGVESYRGTPLGLVDTQRGDGRLEKHFEQQVRSFLRPEMYNRIDRVIAYRPLTTSSITKIAQSRLSQIESRDGMLSRGATLELDEAAMNRLVTSGYEPQYGARPLARTIERDVVTPLAEAICETRPKQSFVAKFTLAQDSLDVTVDAQSPIDAYSATKRVSQLDTLQFATRIRRMFQALLRSAKMIALQNRLTMNQRTLDRQLKACKDEQKRGFVLTSQLAMSVNRDQAQIASVMALGDEIIESERSVAIAHYRHQAGDLEPTHTSLMEIEQQLFDIVIDLIYDGPTAHRPIRLLCYSREMKEFRSTFDAYLHLANERQWELRAYAIMPSNGDAMQQFSAVTGIATPTVLFRWAPEDIRVSSEADAPLPASVAKALPLIGVACPIHHFKALIESGIEMMFLEFLGHRAAAMLSSEAGIHYYLPENAINKKLISTMHIDVHSNPPAVVPAEKEWFDRSLAKSREPRRFYDASKFSIRDHALDLTFNCSSDASQRIAKSIDQFFQQRIMDNLSASSTDADED
jgi:ATP-dependent Clp protease ATP-binding subunit ClpC